MYFEIFLLLNYMFRSSYIFFLKSRIETVDIRTGIHWSKVISLKRKYSNFKMARKIVKPHTETFKMARDVGLNFIILKFKQNKK